VHADALKEHAMPISPAAHAHHVLRTSQAIVDDGAQTPQDWVVRSWQRCLDDHHLDPFHTFHPCVESEGRVRHSRERLEDYLQVARGGMEQLFKHVADLGYLLLLTDEDGITVDFIGNEAWAREAKEAGLYMGANWQEGFAGTNGIGTCLHEGRALTCHQEDHFYVGNVGLSCSTAPLFHPEGRLMGVLDVSALATPNARESQHLALHLTKLYAQMIDDANFMRHFRDHWVLRLATNWALVDVRGDMLLAFDQDGRLTGASTAARRWLLAGLPRPVGPEAVAGRHLSDLFQCTMDDIWRLGRAPNVMDRALLARIDHKSYYGSLVTPRPRARVAALSDATDASERGSRPVALAPSLQRLAGEDRQMRALQHQAQRLANKRINLLIQGETGSGKEVFAKAIHEASQRKDKPFVAVNCAAIPESLIESELFGYTAGTFTGARSRGMKGLILQSDGGTLFLDEIGDMPLHLQTRLLRVLSEDEVLPLGADRPVRLTLTVIAASHRDLRQQIAAGRFREDLYYRLCGATLMLPALRERHDLDHLIDLLLQQEAGHLGQPCEISPEARALLQGCAWPGNVRQLRNALRYGAALSDGDGIFVEHLPPDIRLGQAGLADGAPESDTAPGAAVWAPRMTAQSLLRALEAHRWNITAVAAEAGLARTTIYRQMKRFGIAAPAEASGPRPSPTR
jgi:transcriptional regulator of acetoin/glycerol metabolism